MKRKCLVLILVGIAAVCVSGCSSGSVGSVEYTINRSDYVPNAHQYTQVFVGNLTPVLELTLKQVGREKTEYKINKDLLEVDKLLVNKGDYVKKGQTLVTFKNEDVDDRFKQYESRLEQSRLLYEHYTRLASVDKSTNYDNLIKEGKEDLEISKAYVDEVKTQLSDYRIVAEKSGYIYTISDKLKEGVAKKGTSLLTIVTPSKKFTCTTDDISGFEEKGKYTGKWGLAEVEFVLKKIKKNGNNYDLTFVLSKDSEIVLNSYDPVITINKEEKKNVTYVEKDTIRTYGKKNYLYVVNDNDVIRCKQITVQEIVADYAIIEGDVKEGEIVCAD